MGNALNSLVDKATASWWRIAALIYTASYVGRVTAWWLQTGELRPSYFFATLFTAAIFTGLVLLGLRLWERYARVRARLVPTAHASELDQEKKSATALSLE